MSTTQSENKSTENKWVIRLEELLKVKNVEELKSELIKLAADIQKEIQKFDLNSHLSPSAKTRLKTLEAKYSEVIKAIQKLQKQFDKEVVRSLDVLKKTRSEAETQINKIKTRIIKHRGTIVKASNDLKKRIKKTATQARKSKVVKKAARVVKAKKASTAN